MTNSYTSHAEIIDAIDLQRFAEGLDITVVHARTMRNRRSIPPKYWATVERLAKTAGLRGAKAITASVLAETVPGRAKTGDSGKPQRVKRV